MSRGIRTCCGIGVGLLLMSPVNADAALITSTWTGGNGDWTTASKWSPGTSYPNDGGGNTYDVVVNSGDIRVTRSIAIQKFNLNDGGFWFSGGPYAITTSGLFTWSGGDIWSGTVNLNGGMTAGAGSAIRQSQDVTFNNNGTTTWSGGTHFIHEANGTQFNNPAGSTFDIRTDGILSSTLNSIQFTNGGTIKKSAGTGSSYVTANLNNTGTVRAETGTLMLGNGTSSGRYEVNSGATLVITPYYETSHTTTAGSSISGAGTVRFERGDITINGDYDVTGGTQFESGIVDFAPGARVVNMSGPLTVKSLLTFNTGAAVALPGSVDASVGAIGGSDDVTIGGAYNLGNTFGPGRTIANGGMTINSPNLTVTLGRTHVNNGYAEWIKGQLDAYNNATLENRAGATFDLKSDDDIWYGLQNGMVINNAGTFRKVAGTGLSDLETKFNNSGSVQANSGTLRIRGAGTSSGSFSAGPGATLMLGFQTLTSTSSVSGAGTVMYRSGAEISGTHSVSGTTIVEGGTVNFNNGATFTAGELLQVNAQQRANFNTGKAIVLNDVLLNGTLGGTDAITIAGELKGNGTYSANFSAASGTTVAPGLSPGRLSISGNFALANGSTLAMELAGRDAGSTYDFLAVSGTTTLDGLLTLAFLNDFQNSVTSIDLFTLIDGVSALNGQFDNIASGDRLMTLDGEGSFLVYYGSTNPYGSDKLVLASYQAGALPEPAALSLGGLALTWMLTRRPRRTR